MIVFMICFLKSHYSIADSIVDTYMLIERRQVQPKGTEPAWLVYKTTEP